MKKRKAWLKWLCLVQAQVHILEHSCSLQGLWELLSAKQTPTGFKSRAEHGPSKGQAKGLSSQCGEESVFHLQQRAANGSRLKEENKLSTQLIFNFI